MTRVKSENPKGLRRLVRRAMPEAGERTAERPPREPSPLRRALKIVAAGAWFGLAAGLAEVGFLAFLNAKNPGQYLGEHQLSRNYAWMLPLGQAVVFGGVGLVLAPFAWTRHARRAWTATASTLLALAAYALLARVDGLYRSASMLLAGGLGVSLGPWIARLGPTRRWTAYLSTPVFLGVIAYQGALAYDREVLAERRAVAALPPADRSRPNVLFVVLDTVSADHLSLYGYARPTTPNLQALAERGVVFEMARSPASWTLPAHSSLFTGHWPHELHVGAPHIPLDSAYPTVAEFFAGQGYHTAGFVGNTYYCNSWWGIGRGFHHYEDFYERDMDVSLGAAVRCSALGGQLSRLVDGTSYNAGSDQVNRPKDAAKINQDFGHWVKHHRDRPFFAFLNYMDAHKPYFTPPGFKTHFGLVPETPEDLGHIRDWELFVKAHNDNVSAQPDPRGLALVKDAYDDCIAALDARLGELFRALEQRGILDNTVVVLTADHGEEIGAHNLYDHGISLYRPEVHVPLMVVAPSGVPRGARVRPPVSTRNIAATLADLTGLADASPFPGRSLAEYWDARNPRTRPADDEVVSIIQIRTEHAGMRMGHQPVGHQGTLTSLVVDDKVYIRDDWGCEELYDLWIDPEESANLVERPELAPILDRCRKTWKDLWTRPGVRPMYQVADQEPRGIRKD